MSNILKKKTIKNFASTYYLLGEDDEGIKYWLKAPRWECDWYWGFGYITSFTNNRCPELSRDIASHEHATNFMAEWFTEWNGSKPRLVKQAFSEKDGWELSELFQQFYFLKEAAENFGRGECNVSSTSIDLWKDTDLAHKINTNLIPMVTARILEILTPLNKEVDNV